MLTRIFVNRENLDKNKKAKNNALPTWWIQRNGELTLAYSYKCLGASWSGSGEPLAIEGKVHVWIETESEVVAV